MGKNRKEVVEWMMKLVKENFFPLSDMQKNEFKMRLYDAIQEFLFRVPDEILNKLYLNWGAYEFIVESEKTYAVCRNFAERVVKISFYPLSKGLPQPALLFIVAHEIAHSLDDPDSIEVYTTDITGNEQNEDIADSRAIEWGFKAENDAFIKYEEENTPKKV